MAKVYLSSTLVDLKAERTVVTNWLIAAGHLPVHSYVADSESVHLSCLNDIDACDLYILILGHRYGFVPEESNPEQGSITQLEFRHAGKLGIPRIALLRTSIPDVNLSDLLEPARSARLQEFRDEVGKALRPAVFADEAGLIHGLSTGIQRELNKRIQEELNKRDAKAAHAEQRVIQLEEELRKTREAAVSRVLEQASEPDADDLALSARKALLQGDTALAEKLLRQQEDRAALAAEDSRKEAAERAREIASLAIGRNSETALAALMRAASYQPEDFWTRIELGDAQVVLGQSVPALETYRTALSIAETLAGRDPDNIEWQHDLSVSYDRIGQVLVAQGNGPGALAAYQKGLALSEFLAEREPANTQWQRDRWVYYNRIGSLLARQGEGAKALATFRKCFDIAEFMVEGDIANTKWQRDLSVSHNKIGDMLTVLEDRAGALVAYRKGLDIVECLAESDPANTELQRDLWVSTNKLGDMLVAHRDRVGALVAYQKGSAIIKALVTCDLANTQWQRDLSVSYNKVGDVLAAQDDSPGALVAYRESLRIAKNLSGCAPANTEWLRDLSISYQNIGNVLVAQGNGPGALVAYRKDLAIAELLAERDLTNAQWQVDVVVSCWKLAAFDGLSLIERRDFLRRGLEILRALKQAGRLLPNQDWIDVFETTLSKLDDEAQT